LGFGFEAIGDWQLARFKANPSNRAEVLDSGLWRYTRHPNYFGEAALWWGYYLIAAAAGGWWTVFAPVLMTVLLLRVSGVTLLEQDIRNRRPRYRDYVARTNAFFPGRPKEAA
jgi:steroid 5-alpha reductase family enzyme